MPLVTIKLIEGVYSDLQKQEMIKKTTDAMVAVTGENLREHTWVLIEETKSGEWGVGGKGVTAAHVKARISEPSHLTKK